VLDLSLFEKYETPDDIKLTGKRFLIGNRLSFFLDFARIVWRCRTLSKKNQFDDKAFWDQSDKIREAIEINGGRFEITGLQNLNQQGPFVIVANHMSVLETQVMPWIIGCFSPLSVVMKQSLHDSWVFNPIAEASKSIALTRENLRADIDIIMKDGVGYLKKGRSIVLFPEGTRKTSFSRKGFNSLGVKLAARAGVKVVPVAVKTDFLESGKLISYFGSVHPDRKIYIKIGEPVAVEGRGRKQHESILDFMESSLNEWGFPVLEDQS